MSRTVKIVILSVIAGLLIALVAWGVNVRNTIYFMDGRMLFGTHAGETAGTSVSEFEAAAGDIGNIKLDFVSEEIEVVVTDGDMIRIEETSSRALKEEEKMVCNVSGDTLSAVSGFKNRLMLGFSGWTEIKVTMYVPADYNGNMDLYSTSGGIKTGEVQVDSLRIHSTSGALYLADATANGLDIGSTSGALAVDGGSYDTVQAGSVSGAVKLEAEKMQNVKASTTSGAIVISVDGMPDRIDANTVSGSVLLRLPENDGFTLDTDTVSGSVNNDFAMAHDMYKEGGSTVSVDTVSGSINIMKE